MADVPIRFQWTGEAMQPLRGRNAQECDKRFVIGEMYFMVEHFNRSQASHNHYFAEIAEAWNNLPELQQRVYPSSEILRKHALIACGFHMTKQYVATSRAEAERFARFMRADDEYCVVTVNGNVASVLTAESQSMKSMGRKRFQDSKQAVLDYCASLIGVSADELSSNAGKAA